MTAYSVLYSLYKKETPERLMASLDSMLTQTAPPEEILIVEDGPLTEELSRVLDEYGRAHPTLFTRIKNTENLGLGASLAKGLLATRNELVARMDTDDIAKPHRCEVQLAAMAADPSLAVVGSFVDEFEGTPENVISTRRVPTGHDEIYEFAKRRSAFNHPTVMLRKSAVIEAGNYSHLRRNQDVELFGRMLFAGYRTANVGESLVFFRSDAGLARRRRNFENTKSYIGTVKGFWRMGYASFGDYLTVLFAQTVMFLMPLRVQKWIYKTFLRK